MKKCWKKGRRTLSSLGVAALRALSLIIPSPTASPRAPYQAPVRASSLPCVSRTKAYVLLYRGFLSVFCISH